MTAEAFAPFGLLCRLAGPGQPRIEFFGELAKLQVTGKPRLRRPRSAPKTLPLTAIEMERHLYSSQTFVPMDCESYIVLVAPHGVDDRPDTAV